jgi:radical SAM superfamily enzyme YgiQ (UPF0313 family)
MLELANYFIRNTGNLEKIKGITYKSDEKIIRTAHRPFIKNLDELPFPARDFHDLDGLLEDNVWIGPTIVTSWGCPGHCKFCAASAMAGGRYRCRSPQNVIKEVLLLREKE